MDYYLEKSGFSMPGIALSGNITGSTGVLTDPLGNKYTGYGEVYGVYLDTGAHPSYGLLSHYTGGNSYNSGSQLYYPKADPLGTGIKLYFKILALTGSFGLITGDDARITGLNCEYITTGGTTYSGPSGFLRPSGHLLHKESYKLLPNYAWQNSDISTGDPNYLVNAGGIYPSMLQDNIVNINLQITWSGATGDAVNC